MADPHPPASRHKAKGHKGRRKRQSRRGSAQPPAGPQAGGSAGASGAPAAKTRPGAAGGGRKPQVLPAPVAQGAPAPRSPAPRAPVPRPAPPAPRGPGPHQAYAAIDLGTNNCRLLIARPSGDNFVVVDAFSRVVRLGEGLAQTGRLSDAAMDRALSALSICADKLRRRHVHLARSVATEACRRASNGPAFIERVYQETGIRLDIISAEEEARLAVLGCHILLEEGDGPAVVFDIGGGST
ncbi:MAG TPA: Ppx/GppA family phosphatase, partial [Novosphingobium sp.]|nr:Ppx/GppA family phosphatase [Novosphingobium sp.]